MSETNSANDSLYESYSQLEGLDDDQSNSLKDELTIASIKKISYSKVLRLIKNIPAMCRMHYISREFRRLRKSDPNNHHPVKPKRGEIYNALITENVGSEISDNHLVVIISNERTNIYAEKINVLPIEGDGQNVPPYLAKLENIDLEFGFLDKNPSRIIIPEILTIDKARLQLKIGKIKKEKMIEINTKLKRQLDC